MRAIGAVIALGLAAAAAEAKVVTQAIEYKHGDVTLEGVLAYDDAASGKRPGVLVVHEWWGLNAYAKGRAEQLAALGYVAFALDMYGKGNVTTSAEQAGKWARQFYGDTPLWRARAQAGLDVLRKQERVDPAKIAVIGYCFGGATALQLAYSGADVAAAVSFHGSPVAPSDEDGPRIKARLLILHGADDSFATDEQIAQLHAALKKAKCDWQMVYFGKAVHSFTNPDAGKAGIAGVAYDKPADERSWRYMRDLFDEVFGAK